MESRNIAASGDERDGYFRLAQREEQIEALRVHLASLRITSRLDVKPDCITLHMSFADKTQHDLRIEFDQRDKRVIVKSGGSTQSHEWSRDLIFDLVTSHVGDYWRRALGHGGMA